MKRVTIFSLGLALLAAGATAVAQGDKVPSVKDIMKRLNAGTNCLRANIDKDLKADEPDWPEIQRGSKEFALLAAALGKNTPPKGDKQSWQKLTTAYSDEARALEAASQKKDKRAAQAAHDRLAVACKACHDAHRPK
jgi:hypothetical protein